MMFFEELLNFEHINWSKIRDTTPDEKEQIKTIIDTKLMLIVKNIRIYGVVEGLDSFLGFPDEKFLELASTLVKHGRNPLFVFKNLNRIVLTSNMSNKDYLLNILYIETFLCVQLGLNEFETYTQLCSFLGDAYIDAPLRYYKEAFKDVQINLN
ncbi:MAG: hypothetical protein FWG63_00605 [Defluviitaleaceae bacterium]|nr:hypothetical protein [Defluviitaleaceae bacterium]